MTRRLWILTAALVAVTAAWAGQKVCPASMEKCESQIREMLKTKRDLGILVADSRWGVVVTHVIPGSPAAEVGLAKGDRIFAVNGRDVSRGGTKQYKTILNQAASNENGRVTLTVVRLGRLYRYGARMELMSKEQIDKVVAAHVKDAHSDIGN